MERQFIEPNLTRAILLAATWHENQWRDGADPLPYVCHPVEVLLTLRHLGGITDPVLLCAAALHDVLEETAATEDAITAEFGAEVASLVNELTRKEPSAEERLGLTKDEIYALRTEWLIQEIGAMSPAAQTIKLCDRINNLREAATTRTGKKLTRYIHQTELILQTIPREVHPTLWDHLSEMQVKMAKASR